MKISRSGFKYLINKYPNYKLYSIGKDKYLEFRTLKSFLRNLLEVLKDVLLLPWGLICCIVDFVTEIPEWVRNLWSDLKMCCPIGYIKVEDDEEIQTIE